MAAKKKAPSIVSVVRLSDGKIFTRAELFDIEFDAARRGVGRYTGFVGLIAGEDGEAVRRVVGGYGVSLEELQKRDARARDGARKAG